MLPEPERAQTNDIAAGGVAAADEKRTLLFTDIEGSTHLVEALGERYGDVLDRHFEILREAIARHHGEEINVHGDAFFAIFDDPLDAVEAAVDTQRMLFEENWPEGARIRVRMGIHTGEPRRVTDPEVDYVGIDVHRAARIADVAHGGQIVLSSTTKFAVEGHLPHGVNVRELGTHRLKDIRFPETLVDLVIEGLPSSFAPIRSLDNRPTNLPSALTPFVGRAADKKAIADLLRQPRVRMVTLTGPGGSGKTRLSIEVAKSLLEDFKDGVFQVQLAAVNVTRLVAPTIAQTMGIPEFPGRSVIDTIKHAIGRRAMLLVIDNFEQVLAAAPTLDDLLNDCQNLKFLVTSREALNSAAERECPVLPMQVPAPSEDLLASDAMQLFIERVRAIRPDFQATKESAPVIAEICRRLDGLPLAIELAASRLRLLDPPDLLKRMTERLDALGKDDWNLSGRHRTMRNAITWSYNLLDEVEQQVFCAASVFAGGFSLDAAEALFKDIIEDGDVLEHLTSLLRKSLLLRETVQGEVRLRMLETIRDYGREQLKQMGQLQEFRRRHMSHMLELAEHVAPELASRNQRRSVSRLLTEADNIRAALEYALEQRDADAISRFVKSLLWLWISRSQFTEGEAWISRALQRTGGLVGSQERAAVIDAAGWLKLISGDWGGALPYFQECRPIYERLNLQREATMAMMMEGITRLIAGGDDSARDEIDAALARFREFQDETGIGLTLTAIGEDARLSGDFQKAETCFTEALAAMQSVGNTYWTVALLENLAHVNLQEGDWKVASKLLREALALGEDYEDPMLVNGYVAAMGQVAMLQGRLEDAARLFGATDAFLRQAGVKFAPADQAQFDQNMELTERNLGKSAYATCFAEGALWSQSDAISMTQKIPHS
jgi:predicted ATPase/class 3 adenylate cyclase